MPRGRLLSLGLSCVAVILGAMLGIFWAQTHTRSHIVHAALYAQSWGTTQAAQSLQDSSGGMAQYGYAIKQASSLSADVQALVSWNTYLNSRCGWSMSSTLVDRLASGDWNGRQAGSPTITPQQLASAISNLINSVLGTMTASQQLAMFSQNMSVLTPKGALGLNNDYMWSKYVSATQNSDGTWTVTVSASAFLARKSFFQSYAPGMVTSSTNFYPGEALMIVLSLATGDRGFNDAHESRVRTMVQDLTGVDMSNQSLYGNSGYFARRPLSTFLTDSTLGQFFSNLGF